MNNNKNWDNRWAKILVVMAEWSEDTSSKYSALIVDKKNRLISSGFNGIPRGIKLRPAHHLRPDKHHHFVHAEVNAILNAAAVGVSVEGCVSYLIQPPCGQCAGAIINAGISMIKYLRPHNFTDPKYLEESTGWRASLQSAMEDLSEAGIPLVQIGGEG